MALRLAKEKALQLRRQGKSYSEIKKILNVSKSSLSLWLHDYPLSKKDLVRVRDKNPRRIEVFRETMRLKREEKLAKAYEKAKSEINKIKKREMFVAGFFLYWAEGAKASRGEASVSNTDPGLLRAFIMWLKLFGVFEKNIRVTLHLYSDMNPQKEISIWSKELNVPVGNFTKPYIKMSTRSDITYKQGFGHGTANVRVFNEELSSYILMGIKYLKETFK